MKRIEYFAVILTMVIFVLLAAVPVVVLGADSKVKTTSGPVDVAALPETRALLDYFRGLPLREDKKLLSGQFMGWYPVTSLATANVS